MALSSLQSNRKQKNDSKPVIHRDLATGASKQIITRADGSEWTRYRGANGKFISEAQYEELLSKKPLAPDSLNVEQRRFAREDQKTARTAVVTPVSNQEISSSGLGASARSGSAAIGDIQAGDVIGDDQVSDNV